MTALRQIIVRELARLDRAARGDLDILAGTDEGAASGSIAGVRVVAIARRASQRRGNETRRTSSGAREAVRTSWKVDGVRVSYAKLVELLVAAAERVEQFADDLGATHGPFVAAAAPLRDALDWGVFGAGGERVATCTGLRARANARAIADALNGAIPG